jgi:hypothetical protein
MWHLRKSKKASALQTITITLMTICFIHFPKGFPQLHLAKHVIQFYYLNHYGFRFPIAHWPTENATAPEISQMLWETLETLEDYGFEVVNL